MLKTFIFLAILLSEVRASCVVPAVSRHLDLKIIYKGNTRNGGNSEGERVSPDSQLIFTCQDRDNYRLVGSSRSRCTRTGKWSTIVPICLFDNCGKPDTMVAPMMAHGTDALPDAWPWMVSIYHQQAPEYDHQFVCGGSLINDDWVVTAAHCVTHPGTETIIPETSLILIAGDYQNEFIEDEREQMRNVTKIVIHPNFERLQHDSDLALIRLSGSVEMNEFVHPICLPPSEECRIRDLNQGLVGTVTGWGITQTGQISNYLQQLNLPVAPRSVCKPGFVSEGFEITDNMFCVGDGKGTTGICQGDSGGPFVTEEDLGRAGRRWFLRGVVSWGSRRGNSGSRRECLVNGTYSVFTDVEKFVDWIEGIVDGDDMTCEQLKTTPHAKQSVTHGAHGQRSLGTTVTYSCYSGYRLIGPSVITCGRGGEWTSKPPLCMQIPPTPAPAYCINAPNHLESIQQLANNWNGYSSNHKRHSRTWGRPDPSRDCLLHYERMQLHMNFWNMNVWSNKWTTYHGPRTVTAVLAYDYWDDDTGGRADIVSGGLGSTNVQVKVTNGQMFRGFDFYVAVFGH